MYFLKEGGKNVFWQGTKSNFLTKGWQERGNFDALTSVGWCFSIFSFNSEAGTGEVYTSVCFSFWKWDSRDNRGTKSLVKTMLSIHFVFSCLSRLPGDNSVLDLMKYETYSYVNCSFWILTGNSACLPRAAQPQQIVVKIQFNDMQILMGLLKFFDYRITFIFVCKGNTAEETVSL